MTKAEILQSIKKMKIVAENNKIAEDIRKHLLEAIYKAEGMIYSIDRESEFNNLIPEIERRRVGISFNKVPAPQLSADQNRAIKDIQDQLTKDKKNQQNNNFIVCYSFAIENRIFVIYNCIDRSVNFNLTEEQVQFCNRILARQYNTGFVGNRITNVKYFLNCVNGIRLFVFYTSNGIACDGGPDIEEILVECLPAGEIIELKESIFWKSAFYSESTRITIEEINSMKLESPIPSYYMHEIRPDGTIDDINPFFMELFSRYEFIASLCELEFQVIK